ncbi:alanine racemase [Bacillus sp. 7884-1]|uniref:alanine racemase n=1 Tax=Bacillus sp. 7884-1 TaxID=2021693 RepID=UPI000BA5AB90|nr:alanine racemase [Bacillus sp. 7884-1]PAE34561.1 alanine racemase [Bacillus sp. 7884-1]
MTEQGYFYRDTWAEVDLDYILANVTSVKKLLPPKVEIIAVVKANAYGHGDFKVAESALKAGATYLAVAFMDEAIALRNKGVLAPILVLGATRPEDVELAVEFNITITVFQLEWVTVAQSYLPKDKVLPVHIKLDTGMGRIGIRTKEELAQVIETISRDGRLSIEGIFTHFATADEADQTYLDKQLELFHDLLSVLKEQPKYIHCSNSAAALCFSKANFNAVRLGIAMYGLTPSPEIEHELPFPLKEAFSLHSRLVHVKKLDKGDKVSYGATYEAEDEEWIGTIPIGYADGWIRRLQGQEVLVEGRRVPIVGRICMDQCMVKLPHEVPVGTTVTLIGRQSEEFISVNEIAQKLETINYEVPCIISTRVPRLYKQGGKIVVLKNYLLPE